jgi:hypothetical protein
MKVDRRSLVTPLINLNFGTGCGCLVTSRPDRFTPAPIKLITRSEKSYGVWASQKRKKKKKKTPRDLRLKIYMQATHLLPFYLYIQTLVMALMDGNGQFIGNSFLLNNIYRV